MWRAENPHFSDRPFSPDGAEFLVSIGTGARFQSRKILGRTLQFHIETEIDSHVGYLG
jgi:hypothetical protein